MADPKQFRFKGYEVSYQVVDGVIRDIQVYDLGVRVLPKHDPAVFELIVKEIKKREGR